MKTIKKQAYLLKDEENNVIGIYTSKKIANMAAVIHLSGTLSSPQYRQHKVDWLGGTAQVSFNGKVVGWIHTFILNQTYKRYL